MQSFSSHFRNTFICHSRSRLFFNNFSHPTPCFHFTSRAIKNGQITKSGSKNPEKKSSYGGVESGVHNLLRQIQKDNKVQIKSLKNIIPTISTSNIEENHVIVLLNCCGKFVPNACLKVRNEMCQEVFQQVLKSGQITSSICNNYIQICTENCTVLNHKEFLDLIKLEPNEETYKELLKNVCEGGDVEQAVELLNDMKLKEISIDEEDFNHLVLGHTIQRGIKGAQDVMNTMKAAFVIENSRTNFQIFKGSVIRNDLKEFEDAEKSYKLALSEEQFLQILEKVGYNGNLEFLSKILNLFGDKPISKDYVLKVDYLCLHLIHMQKSDFALRIYEKLVPPVTGKKYAHFLLREMIICREPIEIIIQACENIKQKNLNPYCLENTTEIALRLEFFEDVLEFYNNFENLRPHYFWPLLINSYNKENETGVIKIMKIMMEKNVKIDQETLHNYVIPFFNYHQPKLLIQSLKNCGLTVREILSPLLVTLLFKNEVELAHKTCEDYNVGLESEPLVRILAITWVKTRQTESLVSILQKICESNDKSEDDFVGDFLIKSLKDCLPKDLKSYQRLLEIMGDRKLRLTTNSAEVLSSILETKSRDKEVRNKIDHLMNNLLDLTFVKKDEFVPHPRNMTIDQLECHLEELKHKNMETRGVLRKLIQSYCNLKNFKRVEELREEFLSRNYTESPGMKSSLLQTFVMNDNLEGGMKMYEDLTKNHSNFKLDNFKIIDLANLLVKNDRNEEALKLVKAEVYKNQRNMQGGPVIERNCWELLNSYKNPDDQIQMFDFMVERRICKPTNIILGPLIRIHLKNGNLEKSVELYEKFTNTYNVTPLQLELLLECVKTKNSELTQRILESTVKIYGKTATLSTFVVALAENGKENESGLRKILSENLIPTSELIKKYERWIKEDKLDAMRTLEKVGRTLAEKNIELNPLRIAILKVLSVRNDCQSAVDFYEDLINNDQEISSEFELELVQLLRKSKFKIPDNLAMKIKN